MYDQQSCEEMVKDCVQQEAGCSLAITPARKRCIESAWTQKKGWCEHIMTNLVGRAEAWTRAQSSMLLKPLGDVVGSTGPASWPRRHLSARRAPTRLAGGFSTRFTLQGHERGDAISGPLSMAFAVLRKRKCRPRGRPAPRIYTCGLALGM